MSKNPQGYNIFRSTQINCISLLNHSVRNERSVKITIKKNLHAVMYASKTIHYGNKPTAC